MSGSLFNSPIISLLCLFFAVIIHEVAHGWVADRLGDPTARISGRLTLNPLAHIDVIGSIVVPFFLIITGSPILFGWAKPVPIDPYNLRNPRKDQTLISLAGAMANLFLASFCALLLFLGATSLRGIFIPMIQINVFLAIFNLIPIYPLDGFKVVEGLLSEHAARQWHQLESLGYIMLFIFVFPLFGFSPLLSIVYKIANSIITFLIP